MGLVNTNPFTLFTDLDAVGKPGSGIFLGNLLWPGSFSECHKIPDSHYCLAGFLAHLSAGNITIFKRPGVLGVCMPKECNQADIQQLLQLVDLFVPSVAKYISFPEKGPLSIYGGNVLCEKDFVKEKSSGKTATLCLIGFILLFCFVGTLCELFERICVDPAKTEDEVRHFQPEQELSDRTPLVDNGYGAPMVAYSKPSCKSCMVSAVRIVAGIFKCFSLISNTKTVLSTDTAKGAILSINGIRTLSILWVILGHVYAIGNSAGSVVNLVDILNLLNRFTFLPITNGFFSVDTFFLLSGLLASYLMLRRFNKAEKQPFPIVMMAYFHRFVRLTPGYMFVILFYVNILPMIGNGPTWNCLTVKMLQKPCEDYWWTNLLYINNFYPKKLADECLGWGWYLANDMQFFIISPLIIYIMYRLKVIGLLFANGILMAASIVVTSVIIWHYNLKSLELVADLGTRTTQENNNFSDLVYTKPYCRIIPYLVGLALGYVFHKQMKIKGKLSWLLAMCGWVVAIVCGLSVTYGTWGSVKKGGHKFTMTENIIYGSFCRLSWSIAVAWVIYACQNGFASIVSSILSWRAFIPFSRLTYGAYLIHPMTILVYYGSMQSTRTYSDLTTAFDFVSISAISYAAAFILSICVEYPVMNLEKKIFKQV
eukprot:gene18808-20704_t